MKFLKRNKLLNEVIITGAFIYICILFVEAIRYEGFTEFLPFKFTIFEILKNYFLAISFLLIIEYFVSYELPNNYLFARLFGMFVMITFTLVAFNLFSKTWIFSDKLAINLIYIVSIIYGCIASYYITTIKLKRSLLIGVLNYIIIAAIFVIFTFNSPGGYIFT